jgi:hypothetical protein
MPHKAVKAAAKRPTVRLAKLLTRFTSKLAPPLNQGSRGGIGRIN